MTIQELNQKLDVNLKRFITDRDHVVTGSMRKSVLFDCKMSDAGLSLDFTANFYIQYIEHRKFVPEFFELPSTLEIINTFLVEYIEEII